MPHKSLSISVEPKVLIWARKKHRSNTGEVAKRLKVSENTIAGWESGQKNPRCYNWKSSLKLFINAHSRLFSCHRHLLNLHLRQIFGLYLLTESLRSLQKPD